MISGGQLIVRYAAFAAMATFANILAQMLFFAIYSGRGALLVAIGIGTLIGLVVKFILDKKWIFFDTKTGIHANGVMFLLYSFMGVLTTMVFWVTEIAFALLFEAHFMKYVGAVIGLATGYFIKYHLDRRFVFRRVVA